MITPESQNKDLLKDRLKKDAQALIPTSSVDLQEQTLELVRKEFEAKPAQVIAFPNLRPLLSVAAAIILVAGLIFLQTQKNQPSPELVVSPEVMQQSLEDIAELQNIPDPTELTASLATEPMLDELNAIAEELTATFQGILEIVEPS